MLSAHPQGCAHGVWFVGCAGGCVGNQDRAYPAPRPRPPPPGLPSAVMSPRGARGVQQPLCPHSNWEDAPGDVASRSSWDTADQWPGSSGTRASPHGALCPLSPGTSKRTTNQTQPLETASCFPQAPGELHLQSTAPPWPAALAPPLCPGTWGSPARTGPALGPQGGSGVGASGQPCPSCRYCRAHGLDAQAAPAQPRCSTSLLTSVWEHTAKK